MPDHRLFVIDLDASPPKLIDTVTVGMQPSGMAISHKGDLALIANRAGKSVSVLSIQNGAAKTLAEIPMEQEAAAVVITPEASGPSSASTRSTPSRVLSIDGQRSATTSRWIFRRHSILTTSTSRRTAGTSSRRTPER